MQLQEPIDEIKPKVDVAVRIIRNDNVIETLAQTKHHDLVILRSTRRRTAGGLALARSGAIALTRQLNSSFILFGEPH